MDLIAIGLIAAATPYRERGRSQRQLVHRMWNEGAPIKAIAAAADVSPRAIQAMMRKMRADGWDLPYRRQPTQPKHPDLAAAPSGYKRCPSCERVLLLERFRSKPGRGKSYCRGCEQARMLAWLETAERDARAQSREYREAHPERMRAYQDLRGAIRRGEVVRPDACQSCGRSSTRLSGHHDDYSKPLEVMWLCGRCHTTHHLREVV